MIIYLLLIAQRASSGLQNAFGYRRNNNLLYGSTIASILISVLTYLSLLKYNITEHFFINYILSPSFLVVTIIGLIGVALSFTKSIKPMIHTYEVVATGGIVLSAFTMGVNIIDLIFTVYPGLVLHKGFINLASNRSFIDKQEITNDATGKTYYLEVFNINIPRLNSGFLKLGLAIASIILFMVNYLLFGYEFNIMNLTNIMFNRG